MKAGWKPLNAPIETDKASRAARLLAQLRRCPTRSREEAIKAVEAWADGGDEAPAIEALRKVVAECDQIPKGFGELKGQALRAAACAVFDDCRVKSAAEEAFE